MTLKDRLSLEQAAFRYATDAIRERIELAAQRTQSAFPKNWGALSLSQQTVEMARRISLEVVHYSELRDAFTLARSLLVDRLREGSLLSTGVRTLPTTELQPSQIPQHIFDNAKIDWKRDVIENAGSRFDLVRVHQRVPDTFVARITMGRPSKKDTIDLILQQMIREGRPIEIHQKRVCEDVRSRAESDKVDTSSGFSDPVIKTRIRRLLTSRSSG